MIAILSPAKTLDLTATHAGSEATLPRFPELSKQLVTRLRKLSPDAIGELMQVSPKLAALNAERYQEWQWPYPAGRSAKALFAFRGEVYSGLDADSLDLNAVLHAQEHLRILSGLYGILRPLDLMMAYRLEMGTPFAAGKARNLYEFWGDRLSKALMEDLEGHDEKVIVNLASQEYYKAVNNKALKARVITPVFKERHGKGFRMVTIYAKHARGRMARYISEHGLTSPGELKAYAEDNYLFEPALSTEDTWTYVRG